MDKIKITLDTNMVQALCLIHKSSYLGCMELQNSYNRDTYNSILKLYKNMDQFKFYVTGQIYNEVVECDKKHHGIYNFMKQNCKIRIPVGYKTSGVLSDVARLKDLYLKKDIMLSNTVRGPQQAISSEIKNGCENHADALAVSENNYLNGIPFVTLNEKHLIYMSSYRNRLNIEISRAILGKNVLFVNTFKPISKNARFNLKSPTATTFRVKDVVRGL